MISNRFSMRKGLLFSSFCVLILAFAVPTFFAQQENSEEKKVKVSSSLELLDSSDYVVVLRTGQKIRVKNKPVIKGDLIWFYLRKKMGQYKYQSLQKGLIDYEATEQYNSKLNALREERRKELEKKKLEEEKRRMREAVDKGKIKDHSGSSSKTYTQKDLNKKIVLKAITIEDITGIAKQQGLTVKLAQENEKYEKSIFSILARDGSELLSGEIEDLLSIRQDLQRQVDTYNQKIEELYKEGIDQGDKFKFNTTIVEIQSIMKSLQRKIANVDLIVEKLPPPPKPEEPEKGKSEKPDQKK